MQQFSTEQLLIILSAVVVMSYLFSIIGKYVKVPSVLLLLGSGILLRYVVDANQINFSVPSKLVELLGVIGLVMIILEAGLDLKIGRDKFKVIRDSFFSAFVIFVVTTIGVTTILFYLLHEPLNQCIVYAIPLSIISSAIVIPSIHALTPTKKEFLVYEASFADIIGILFFNLFTEGEQVTSSTVGHFFLNIGIAIPLSLILCACLFLILTKSKMGVRFFLVMALIVLLYAGGKLLHLPSLILVLMFGMLMNNWQLFKHKKISRYFAEEKVKEVTHLLHSITAETSFIIRTFFFILFGYAINLSLISDNSVLLTGSLIVLVLFVVRWLYLRFFLHTRIYPEVFFIPRGLVTVLLFYRIPDSMKLNNFNEGILFFIIIATALVMMLGMIFYKQTPETIVEEN
jgi:Kef-type K+ transport system membrane component KefB